MMFGSSLYVINMNLVDELSIMPNFSHFWFINAFYSQYEMTLGYYQLLSYRTTENEQTWLYMIFFVSSFLIQVVFVNMLIAIMGDAFNQASESKEVKARLTKIKIMSDYIHLINLNDDNDKDEAEEDEASDDEDG